MLAGCTLSHALRHMLDELGKFYGANTDGKPDRVVDMYSAIYHKSLFLKFL